jgi:hypothetical protein
VAGAGFALGGSACERERDTPDGRHGGDEGDGAHGSWQSSLTLRFGQLGEVAAKVVLSGGQLHIRLDAPEAGARGWRPAAPAWPSAGRRRHALEHAGDPRRGSGR